MVYFCGQVKWFVVEANRLGFQCKVMQPTSMTSSQRAQKCHPRLLVHFCLVPSVTEESIIVAFSPKLVSKIAYLVFLIFFCR